MTAEAEQRETGLTTHRIEALTDGIFAIAMTILVLNLDLPQTGRIISQDGLYNLLAGQSEKFFNYALSFVLLANFWIIHHQQFHSIRRTDRTHIWLNVFILMFVALVPFSTSLIGDYSVDLAADLFFAGNLFMLGSLFLLNWSYATDRHRLVDRDIDPKVVARGKRRGSVVPLVALLAIGLSFLDQRFGTYIYLLIPLALSFPYFRK